MSVDISNNKKVLGTDKASKLEFEILNAALLKKDLNKTMARSTERDSKIIELHRMDLVQAVIKRNSLGKAYIGEVKITNKGIKRRAEMMSQFGNIE